MYLLQLLFILDYTQDAKNLGNISPTINTFSKKDVLKFAMF